MYEFRGLMAHVQGALENRTDENKDVRLPTGKAHLLPRPDSKVLSTKKSAFSDLKNTFNGGSSLLTPKQPFAGKPNKKTAFGDFNETLACSSSAKPQRSKPLGPANGLRKSFAVPSQPSVLPTTYTKAKFEPYHDPTDFGTPLLPVDFQSCQVKRWLLSDEQALRLCAMRETPYEPQPGDFDTPEVPDKPFVDPSWLNEELPTIDNYGCDHFELPPMDEALIALSACNE